MKAEITMTNSASSCSRVTLALAISAMVFTTGCNNKTYITKQAAPSTSSQPSTPTTPDGKITPEDAKKKIEAAYKGGYQEGFDSVIEGLSEQDRSKAEKSRKERFRDRMQWRRKVRREEIAKILEEKYQARFGELVEEWSEAHPNQEFECDEENSKAAKPIKIEAVNTAASQGASKNKKNSEKQIKASPKSSQEKTKSGEVSIENLTCWRKLCPSMDRLIRRGPGFRSGFRKGYRKGFKDGFDTGLKRGEKDEDEDEDEDEDDDVDTSDMGVELPSAPITSEELTKLTDKAKTNGLKAGKEDANEEIKSKKEDRQEKREEREEKYRENLRRRLPGQIEKALNDCKVEKDASDQSSSGGLPGGN
jgi:hypothetical protein